MEFRYLSVIQVSQDNRGKISSGIDGISKLTSEQCLFQENPIIRLSEIYLKNKGIYARIVIFVCYHHQEYSEDKRTGIVKTKYIPKVRQFSQIRLLFSRSRISGDAYVRFWSRGDYGNVVFDCNIIASWSCKRLQGFVCSTRKAVHDLSLERRETVWFLSTASVKN